MKIFYELEEYDLLEFDLQAIGTFIRRKKVMGYHRENYLNTVQFTRKLLETNPLDKSARAALHQENRSHQGRGGKGVAPVADGRIVCALRYKGPSGKRPAERCNLVICKRRVQQLRTFPVTTEQIGNIMDAWQAPSLPRRNPAGCRSWINLMNKATSSGFVRRRSVSGYPARRSSPSRIRPTGSSSTIM